MKRHFEIHPDYSALSSELLEVFAGFGSRGRQLQRSRNHVRALHVEGGDIVVKSYERLTQANRIIYSLFRKTKAQRAYENALLLLGHGVATPFPLAYADWFRGPILRKSFFVSRYEGHPSCRELFDRPLPECRDALVQFGRFLYRLHRHGLYHGDLNLSNVLCSRDGENYIFWLIDNNRLRVRKHSKRRGLRNLRRIKLPLDKLAIVAMEYAAADRSDEYETALGILWHRHIAQAFATIKRALKKTFCGPKEKNN
ncbi:MAG: lipopolysaccharide kinase InaA family protein [Breznakibacter sp.]